MNERSKKLTGALIATAVAGLFLGACKGQTAGTDAAAPAANDAKMVKCAGVNECKGQGACAGANNACKSQNSCKGQGVMETTEADCTAKGGTIQS